MAELLIHCGADVFAVDKDGLTALDWAQTSTSNFDLRTVKELLRNAQAPLHCRSALSVRILVLSAIAICCPFAVRVPSFPLRTSPFALHTSHFTLHTSNCTLHTSHLALGTLHFAFQTSHLTFHASSILYVKT